MTVELPNWITEADQAKLREGLPLYSYSDQYRYIQFLVRLIKKKHEMYNDLVWTVRCKDGKFGIWARPSRTQENDFPEGLTPLPYPYPYSIHNTKEQ